MSSQDRIEELRAQHRSLDHNLDSEIHRAIPDIDVVADLKRQKLRIKDEIVTLEHSGP